ncbi:hypothetical protein SAMN02799624_05441 [Paenibacillus sp. UNC496MF]|uniref:hypothetical protein n=1 Tax=Paenibacillus sp. UNC496MF TaxID=1502753 RepID=UPI0008E57D5C|nr:hypothetical protein [Paenibacillus sp. UNC496MF]SFJ66231.1 hypothetical protein SAMN02799624_05441 [Paenibacillus sp. UNC496MF]
MATTEKYQNLPGVKVTYEDGNLYAGDQRLAAGTQSILIIGSAVDGPVGEPISVRDLGVKSAEKLFGGLIDRVTKEPVRASLVRGMYEAIRAGNEDVRLLRVDGVSARTELKAKDIARSMEQFLDYADGNKAFSVDLNVPAGGTFVDITKVEAVDALNNATVVANAIDYVDRTAGAEAAYFFADKMRPGEDIKVSYNYETRNYMLVPRLDGGGLPDLTDPDYTLTRDTVRTHYFYSARRNWSDKLESGHIPTVTVKDLTNNAVFTIPSLTPSGDYIYRVGKGASGDPLKDAWSAADYADGGIFFTAAYDAEVAKGTYPNITSNVKVFVEYAWYTSMNNEGSVTDRIPGVDAVYDLSYTPQADGFSVYYMDGANKVELVEGVDYTYSALNKNVTVFAGAAPVSKQLYASYKTNASTVQDPKIVVEGKYPGTVYGSLTDIFDAESIRGVSVKVEIDPQHAADNEKIITFFKPAEKKLFAADESLVYKTVDLAKVKVRTVREFIKYVNADPMNNIVNLSADNAFGSVPAKGLLQTGDGAIPEAVFLGQEAPGQLKEDPAAEKNTPARYPWLGQDGIFDVTKEADMKKMFEKLGGVYTENARGETKLVQNGIYSNLENYVVDVIVLLDAYANTAVDSEVPNKNFATQLAQHCAVVTAKTWETIGVLGVSPALDSSLVSIQEYVDILTGEITADSLSDARKGLYAGIGVRLDYVNNHYMFNESNFDYVLDEEGTQIDIGRYVSVVFGPELGQSSDKLGSYVTSGAAVYGALITTLSAESATTNKALDSVTGLRYILSEAQHNQLVGGRYVTFDRKIFGGTAGQAARFIVKDGVTAASSISDYSRLSTLRITHAAVQLIRQKADPFIGLPNGMAQRNALSAEIQAGLDKLKENGVIQRFKFTIYSSVQDAVLGNAFITLELVPQFETRKFMTSVVLKAS